MSDRKYRLLAIERVEEKQDLRKGTRYLLELNLRQETDNKTVHISEYVFQPINTTHLCYPAGLQWNNAADIYFVVTAKNQGVWVQHLIDNMERIYRETNDQHFHLVIFDYESPDIDLNVSLKRSGLKRYTVIKRPGIFIKTQAYNEAVSLVKDSNSIVFLLDLHLDISSNFLQSIRKVNLSDVEVTCITFCPILLGAYILGYTKSLKDITQWQIEVK